MRLRKFSISACERKAISFHLATSVSNSDSILFVIVSGSGSFICSSLTDKFIEDSGYDVRCFGFDPYNAKDFVARWEQENGPFGIEKVIQGVKTESVPLGELKKLAEQRKLLFDEALMVFAMGNCITLEDTNGNRKLLKMRREQKIDAVSAMMDAYVAYKLNRDAFE